MTLHKAALWAASHFLYYATSRLHDIVCPYGSHALLLDKTLV
jgi:hypothetical protein